MGVFYYYVHSLNHSTTTLALNIHELEGLVFSLAVPCTRPFSGSASGPRAFCKAWFTRCQS